MDYIKRVLVELKEKNPQELEFHQAATEILCALEPVIAKHPEYEKVALLERLVEPERVIMFRVPWMDDQGNVHVNKGYRVQFNSAIGPYKGGLRFHPSVNLSIIKFLGLEQVFKNSLTGLHMGGGKGGSDFDPKGKSDNEIMHFCQSFMTELYRHITPDRDIPAGDIGVGTKEIGYLFGQYKKIVGEHKSSVITGKGVSYGGSFMRPEATGFGATYFIAEVLKHFGESISGKTFALSGFGNVAWSAATKIIDLGGKVVSISGPDGYVFIPNGMTKDMLDYMIIMRNSGRDKVQEFVDKVENAFFVANKKPWGNVKADIYMPCATQNEICLEDAEAIVKMGIKIVNEVSNMPTTNEAIAFLNEHGVLICPSKAVNAGGVAVSGLEMTQNIERLSWPAEEIDKKLQTIMANIYNQIVKTCEEYNLGYNLLAGANIAGFIKIADAMLAQGLI